MVHLRRYILALCVLLGLFCAYAVAVAPWIAPPKIARVVGKAAAAPPLAMVLRDDLAALFPQDAWERKSPKIVETEQCTLLIQDYLTTPEGRLELNPCTLVFQSRDEAGEGEGGQRRGRPVVLQAPKAELTFEKPFDVARGEFGRVEKGTLSGEIRIFSPPTKADGTDAFELVTRAVWLDRESIRTANDVEFRYGASSGRGRDLEIALVQPAPDQPRPKGKLRGVQSVTLKQLDYLRVAMAGGGLLPGGGAKAEQAEKTTKDVKSAAPLEIRCRGNFMFDVARQVARFQDGVTVTQAVEGALPDALTCRDLLLDMGRDEKAAKAPAASAEDPLAGRLQRVIAMGEPAVLESPSRAVRAEAAQMEYSLAERSVHLKSDAARGVPRVSLAQLEQHFVAPELHYEMPTSGRLGKLNAAGPGELRMADGGAERGVVTARWGRSLEMRPQERNHVISLREAASVDMQAMGRFEGSELHLWVRETAAPAAAIEKGAAEQAATSQKPSQAILPDRMLAIGKVRMVSPGLDVDTGRLEAWFRHLPVEEQPARQPRGIDHPIREPVARVSYAEDAGPSATIHGARARAERAQKFQVTGDVVRTQLFVRGSKFDVEDLSIRGRAQIDEVHTPQPQLEPLRVRGDFLEVRSGTRPEATVEISGFPAEVAGRGMALAGSKIEMQRSSNEVRIDGPGEARLPAGGMAGGGLVPLPGAGGAPAVTGTAALENPAKQASQTAHIIWQQGMVFDGLVARFMGEVQVRTAAQTAHMPMLEATLTRRLDFGTPLAAATAGPMPTPVGLARVLLDGGEKGVYIESRGVDELGQLVSRDQMSVRGAVLDQVSGGLRAQGPGWVSTVRRGASAGAAIGGGAAVAASAPQNADALTSIHVAFEREMVGDLNQRWIEFRQEVRTTYSPAEDFGDVIAAEALAPLGERMVLMRSQTLRITDTSFAQARSFALAAEGGAKVEGRNMFVDAPRLKYASDKEALTIEGEGRVLARIDYFQGGRPVTTQAQRIWYNLRSGELKLDGANIQFPLGGELKFPGLGAAR